MNENHSSQHLTNQSRKKKKATVYSAILSFILILVILQLWLLTSTMSAYLGGDNSVLWPAAIASLICLSLNVGLLYYINQLK